jgi:copper chaperone CopZ
MDRIEINVKGMTCDGCAKSIESALTSRLGVQGANANLETGIVTIEFEPEHIQPPSLVDTIENAGFDIV